MLCMCVVCTVHEVTVQVRKTIVGTVQLFSVKSMYCKNLQVVPMCVLYVFWSCVPWDVYSFAFNLLPTCHRLKK